MGLIVNAFGGFLLGVVAFFITPLVADALTTKQGPRAAGQFRRYAIAILGRVLLIKRKHGGYWLVKSSFDAKHGKEKANLNGETKRWGDPENLMSRLYGWPFGLAHEKSETITDARFAELGEVLRDRARSGSLVYTREREDGRKEEFLNGYVPLPDDDTRLVNPDHALALMAGDAEPGTTDWSIEITKKSQSPFATSNFVDYIGGLVSFAVPFGAMWLAREVLVDGSVSVGIGMVHAFSVVGVVG